MQIRLYSNPARRPSFLSQFVENIRQEMQKNKEMKESLKKFREEAQKLEQSEALRTARQKFHAVESEASKSSEVIKEKLDTLKEKVYTYSQLIYNDNDYVYNYISLYSTGTRSHRGSE